jgi:hypothetical protein
MRLGPNHHHRRSIRLKGYNYTQPGAYFVTICTKNRACLFGEAVDGKMLLNDAGRMVQTVWDEIPVHCPGRGGPLWPPSFGAGTGACPYNWDIVAECDASVQNNDDETICQRG